MPPNTEAEHQDQWVEIADFSPGIYSYNPSASTSDRLLPAPPGAADAAGTYACLALPNGGLGALPGVTQTYTWPGAFKTGTNYLVGFLIHDELGSGNTEAVIISEYDDGVNHKWQAYSYVLETASNNLIINTSQPSAAGIFGSPYPQMTRAFLIEISAATLTSGSPTVTAAGFPGGVAAGMLVTVDSGTGTIPAGTTVLSVGAGTMTMSANASGSGTAVLGFSSTTTPGQPVVVFPNGGPANPSPQPGQLYLYPNPAAPTVFGVLPLITTSAPYSSISGQVIVHQSRIIVFAATNYGWPTPSNLFLTNENINFTDPPNSTRYGNQQTVLVAENPYGYGAGGSISAGELFIVKKRGGAVIVTGDIFSPTVTKLPGVQPTGGFYGQGASGMAGFFYCSYANGAWLWNGSNTAQKISRQLDDNFFLPAEFLGGIQSNNYGFFVQCIGDHAYFSNNYLYDMDSHSWWKYHPDAAQGGTNLFWVNPVAGRYIYAANLSFTNNGNFLYRFDTSTPAQTYQWRSLPLRLNSKDRVCDVREVVVRASCTAANCALTVTIFDKGVQVFNQTQAGTIGTGPDIIKFKVGAFGLSAPQIQVKLVNSSTGDMAVVHDIAMRYKSRAHQAATN